MSEPIDCPHMSGDNACTICQELAELKAQVAELKKGQCQQLFWGHTTAADEGGDDE